MADLAELRQQLKTHFLCYRFLLALISLCLTSDLVFFTDYRNALMYFCNECTINTQMIMMMKWSVKWNSPGVERTGWEVERVKSGA